MNKTSCYCCVFPALSLVKKSWFSAQGPFFCSQVFKKEILSVFSQSPSRYLYKKNWSNNKTEIMKCKRPWRKLRYKYIFVTAYLCSFSQGGQIYWDRMLTRVIVHWYQLSFCSYVVNWQYRHFKSHSCQILLVCWLIYIIETRNNKYGINSTKLGYRRHHWNIEQMAMC